MISSVRLAWPAVRARTAARASAVMDASAVVCTRAVRRVSAWEHRWPALWITIGVVVGLLAATAFGQLQTDRSSALLWPAAAQPTAGSAAAAAAGAAAAAASAAGTGAASTAGTAGLLNGHVQPGELSIPSIGVRSSFVNLGLNRDGTLQVPRSYNVVGWYAGGPAPGDAGGPPAIIAGHVDSTAGPGVFFHLRELTIGSDIAIRGADGAVRHFRVYRLATYPKDAFPAAEVYASTGNAEVRLITCTGTFIRARRSYDSNLVAYAAIVGAGA